MLSKFLGKLKSSIQSEGTDPSQQNSTEPLKYSRAGLPDASRKWLDPNWRYTTSDNTDLRETFARLRKEKERNNHAKTT